MPITSSYEDQKFGAEFLTDILDWVSENFTADEIWDEAEMKEWAQDNGYVEDDSQ